IQGIGLLLLAILPGLVVITVTHYAITFAANWKLVDQVVRLLGCAALIALVFAVEALFLALAFSFVPEGEARTWDLTRLNIPNDNTTSQWLAWAYLLACAI